MILIIAIVALILIAILALLLFTRSGKAGTDSPKDIQLKLDTFDDLPGQAHKVKGSGKLSGPMESQMMAEIPDAPSGLPPYTMALRQFDGPLGEGFNPEGGPDGLPPHTKLVRPFDGPMGEGGMPDDAPGGLPPHTKVVRPFDRQGPGSKPKP
jgi:hypothetical protein